MDFPLENLVPLKLLWFCLHVKLSNWEENIAWVSQGNLVVYYVHKVDFALALKTARKLPEPRILVAFN